MIPAELFHPVDGEAATSPAHAFCTADGSRGGLSSDALRCLGMGQAAAKSEEQQICLDTVGMGDVGTWLQGRMDSFLFSLCKVKPSGKVFPLPSSLATLGLVFPSEPPCLVASLRNLVLSLNSLNGEGLVGVGSPSQFQIEILTNLADDCRRMLGWKERMTPSRGRSFSVCVELIIRGMKYLAHKVSVGRMWLPHCLTKSGELHWSEWWNWVR